MDERIVKALDFIKSSGLRKVTLAIPFTVKADDISELRDNPLCVGVIMRKPSQDIAGLFPGFILGTIDGQGWRLEPPRGPIVFAGSHLLLTRKMVLQAMRKWVFSVYCKVNGEYKALYLYRFILWWTAGAAHRWVARLAPNNPLRKAAEWARNNTAIRGLLGMTGNRNNTFQKTFGIGAAVSDVSMENTYRELLARARRAQERSGDEYVPRRVLLVNAGLAAGGAERQIVNTLIGLKNSGECESVGLLAEYIDYAPNLDFFLPELEKAEIEVNQVVDYLTLDKEYSPPVAPEVAEALSDISSGLIEGVLNLVEEFRLRKPEVVHAWQDSSSIKAGIAGVIAGVPRIVLAGRNVAPMNFTYYQDYMRPAYRALAELGNVTFINNSEAGAMDYVKWLGLTRERFKVLRNGVDLSHMRRTGSEEAARLRRDLGIPQSAQVIGSVFRFWPEKRPMLWLEVASKIASQFPDAHFLIVGEGIMRREMEKFIRRNKLTGRAHLPGAKPDIAPFLSVMDIFMLTSEFEGTPNVVLEAQWLGLPVVATDSGGTRESFAEGQTGFLAERADAMEISNLVARLLRDQELRSAMGGRGREFVSGRFSVSRMIKETLDIYGFTAKHER